MVSMQVLATCLLVASNTYHIPSDVMIGIMYVEGGHIGQEAGPNSDGSYDLGLMQINSLWVSRLAQIWHVDNATARVWLRDNDCENIYVGAWILKQKIAETGSLYEGIARYHSASRRLGEPYAATVMAAVNRNDYSHHRHSRNMAEGKPRQLVAMSSERN